MIIRESWVDEVKVYTLGWREHKDRLKAGQASVAVEGRLSRAPGLWSPAVVTSLQLNAWSLSRPGIEPMSPCTGRQILYRRATRDALQACEHAF